MAKRVPASERRTSESEMALAITRLLRRAPDYRLSMADIRHLIPKWTRLSKADRAESTTRPGEELWMQVIRNVRSHGAGKRYGLRSFDGGFVLVVNPPAAVVKTLKELAAVHRLPVSRKHGEAVR